MKVNFPVCAGVTIGGEILTRPATFLPGAPTAAHPTTGFAGQNLNYSPIFAGVLNFNLTKTMMAQPLLKGDLQ